MAAQRSAELTEYLAAHEPAMLALLCRIVEQESPSLDKAAVDVLGETLAHELEQSGARIRFHPQRETGNVLQADFPASSAAASAAGKTATGGKRRLLVLGHHDTVYERGTLAHMPFRIEKGRIFGPGVFDMKAGIVQAIFAIRALQELHGGLPRPVTVLFNPDEEIGSPASRRVTEKLARQCSAVLVAEPAAGPHGACKTSRKGIGHFLVRVSGRATHAGLDFERGASAIVELARQVVAISGFTQLERGVTVNPGVIRGGSRANVVAGFAEVEVDARIASVAQGRAILRRFAALRPVDRRCRIEVTGEINRWPFPRSRATVQLYRQAKEIARELGFALGEASVGGGSDGNLTAALGVPTLDGLGAVGEGAHAPHESIVRSELVRRAALLARLIEEV